MTAPFESADRRCCSSARWADLVDEEEAEQAAPVAEPPLREAAKITLASLPRFPRQAPESVFRAAVNLYKEVALRKVTYADAMRWSHRLEAPSGPWLRKALGGLKPPVQPSKATASAGKACIKPAR